MNHPVFPVPATPAEAVRLLDAPLEALLDSAAALRERHHGKRISLCAIINGLPFLFPEQPQPHAHRSFPLSGGRRTA